MNNELTLDELMKQIETARLACEAEKARLQKEAEERAAAEKREREVRAKAITIWAQHLLEGKMTREEMSALIADYLKHANSRISDKTISSLGIDSTLSAWESSKIAGNPELFSWLFQ